MKRIFTIFLILLAASLLGLRLALPFIIQKKANTALSQVPDYTGHVDSVSLGLLRGRFLLSRVIFQHKSGNPQLLIERFGVAIHWWPLLRGHVVATVTIVNPVMQIDVSRLPKGPPKPQPQKPIPFELPDLLQSIIPFRIDAFYLLGGQIRMREVGAKPGEDQEGARILVTDLNVTIENLTNSLKVAEQLTARGTASAKINQGQADLKVKINPSARTPEFDLQTDIKNLDLPRLNPLFDHQWGVTVSSGTFSFFSEASAADGAFKGYVRPLINDLKMEGPKKAHNPLKVIKNSVVGAVNAILKNHKTNTLASEIPFQGRFENPKIGIWEAIVEVFRQGFIEALRPRFDKNYKPNPKAQYSRPAP